MTCWLWGEGGGLESGSLALGPVLLHPQWSLWSPREWMVRSPCTPGTEPEHTGETPGPGAGRPGPHQSVPGAVTREAGGEPPGPRGL